MESVPPPIRGMAPWTLPEPSIRNDDAVQHSEEDRRPLNNQFEHIHFVVDNTRPARRRTPPTLQRLPHLPGVTQYLQHRESQNGAIMHAVHSPAISPSEPAGRAHNERKHSTCPDSRRSAATQLPKQPPLNVNANAKSMSSRAPGSSQASPKRSAPAAGPQRGTQHAPLEILSSPEPDPKRRKRSNTPQSACSKPREALRAEKPMNYEGFSRQEMTRTLAESTIVKPKTRYYAVAVGRVPGVYYDWATVEEQVNGFPGARHKKFKTKEEASGYIKEYQQYLPSIWPEYGSPPLKYEEFPHSARISQPAESFWQDTRPSLNYTGLNWPGDIPFDSPNPRGASLFHPQAGQGLDDIGQDFIPLDDGPKLVPEQQHVVDLIVQGHNVFYTGSAGCGKSTILKAFVKQLEKKGKKVKIVAPTNLAALNVGGQTTWNFAGWTPDSMKIRIDKLMENSRGKESFKKFDETDVLVIDEISMIENLMFERLNMIMKASRGQKFGGGAFGGVQLVVTGDVSTHKHKQTVPD